MNCTSMIRILSLFTIAVMWANMTMAKDWYVDQKAGFDTQDGSKDAPLKTLDSAMVKAAGGDNIYLQPGEYPGIIKAKRPTWKNLYKEKFVTIQPAPGIKNSRQKISIAKVVLGARAGFLAKDDRSGKYDAWLKIKGVKIPDGVYIFGFNHVHIEDCLIERIGPHVGTVKDIEKFAVTFGCGDDLVLKNSELTNTAGGVVLSSLNSKVLGNQIHDITHDGIRCVSSKHCLIEGNRIYNLDDGVEDGDPRGKGWNRHCDAIHIFIPGPGLPRAKNSNLTVRGNVMYNCESQAMQFNNYLRVKDVWNEKILIENNIFGPTRANVVNIAEPVDGIIFRHNTFVYFPEGQSFKGLNRTIHCKNHTFRITPKCKNAQVYNNILVNAFSPGQDWFVSNNLIIGNRGIPTRFDVFNADPNFVDVKKFDGKISANSPAVNAGTAKFAPTPIHPTDFYGTPRDARPDCGAYELPGQKPEAEKPRPKKTLPVTLFVEDLKDGNKALDPWLDGPNQSGMSWQPVKGFGPWHIAFNNNKHRLTAQGVKGDAWLICQEGGDWVDFTVIALAQNAYNKNRAGLLLRANDNLEGYFVDLAKGKIVKRQKDAAGKIQETVLKSGKELLPRRGEQTYKVSITNTPEGPKISVDSGGDGTVELEAVDNRKTPIKKGGLALMNHSHNGSHRTDWHHLKVIKTKQKE